MIIVQSPLRVSFFGGGTDFPGFYLEEGGCVLSSTIDKYIFVTVKNRFDNYLRVGYTKTELVEDLEDLKHELIRESLRKAGIIQGVEITTMGDIPSAGSGLGSSSTVIVGTLQALYTYLGEIVPAERLAREACEIEIDILGKPVGVQDQYIAAYGGLRFIEFSSNGDISVESVVISQETQRRLGENLLLFFTGTTRSSVDILSEQRENISNRIPVLREMKNLAFSARKELEAGNVDEIGHMLHYGWNLKKQLASRISNEEIDSMYKAGRKAGAHGGKITGAGGGGFMLLYCPKENQDQVREVFRNYQEVPFRLEPDGAKVVFNYQRSSAGVPVFGVASRGVSQYQPTQRESDILPEKIPSLSQATEKILTLTRYVREMQDLLDHLPLDEINQTVQVLQSARFGGKQVFIFGNGGSASTATHFACDLAKNTKRGSFPHFRVISLTNNMAEFSAYANDDGYENVFVHQLANQLEGDDIVIGISASGNSENVIRAIEYAKGLGSTTIGFTGFDGGKLARMVDISLHVNCTSYEQSEDMHLMFEHMIVTAIKDLSDQPMLGSEMRQRADFVESERSGWQLPIHQSAEDTQLADVLTSDPNALRLLYEINRAAINHRSVVHLLERVFRTALDQIGGVSGSLLFFNNEGYLEGAFKAYRGQIAKHSKAELQEISERGLAAWVAKKRQATLVQNTLEDDRWFQKEWELEEQRPRSAISVPLYVNNQLLAVITLVREATKAFTQRDLAICSAIPIPFAMNIDV